MVQPGSAAPRTIDIMSRQANPDWRPGTLAVHAGQEPDETTGAIAPPIYQTSTFAQEGVGRPTGGWEYARTGNPTRQRLEDAIAALEDGTHGLAFASGSAAAAAIAGLVRPGERVLISDDVYGGTYRLFERVLRDMGVDAVWLDLSVDPETVLAEQLTPDTRMVWLKSPSNPLLKLVDIMVVAASSHVHRGARGEPPIVVVDNTFASPLSQQPLKLGADIVYHSATKYLSGHSDTINGVLATSREDLFDRLKFLQNAIGAVPGPFDCYLVLRGLRTLELRITRHSANGLRVAEALASRSDIEELRYPGLTAGPHAHPQAVLAQRQMRYPGGIDLLPTHGDRQPFGRRSSGADLRIHRDLLAGGVAGRRRVAHRDASWHDPRCGPGIVAGSAPLAHPFVGRHRGSRRPRGRHHGSPRPGVTTLRHLPDRRVYPFMSPGDATRRRRPESGT